MRLSDIMFAVDKHISLVRNNTVWLMFRAVCLKLKEDARIMPVELVLEILFLDF